MKRLSILFTVIALIFSCAAGAYGEDDIATHKVCDACGMDREQFRNSRVLIEYQDGHTMGFCSINCAAGELKTRSNQIKNIRVADYNSAVLIDAGNAAWVIMPEKPGVMTPQAKWAFGEKSAARAFIDKNGGELTGFDQVIHAVTEENIANNHAHMDHHAGHTDPGSQMLYNPAFGDQIYHTHPAGMWMFNYKFTHVEMNGLRDGGTDIPVSSVGPMKQYPYMMIPTGMSMDMHMFMAMYGITDQLTVMGMGSYQENRMRMQMDMGMGMGRQPSDPMCTGGFGDTELTGIYKINDVLTGSLGLSIPTGSIDEKVTIMNQVFRAPYDMQLGSGTFDLKPSLTYSWLSSDKLWNLGAQATYTWHIGKNDNDWARGDNFKLTWWLQRALGPATSWVRMVFNDTGRIGGSDPDISKLMNPMTGAPTPDADPGNYGGQRLDFLTGVSLAKGCFSIGVEGGIPLYENLNGLQLRTDWMLTVAGQVMF
jgi:nitrous oxide reductase accessory protein NosL